MAQIDVSKLTPVGEFGSQAWCEACALYGVEILENADLPADLAWGFSETYCLPPERLVSTSRPVSGYFFMVEDGRVSGGDGIPEACRALPGFHVEIPWGLICNQSRSLYGDAGRRQRAADEQALLAAVERHLGRPNPLKIKPRDEPFWPPQVTAALRAGAEEGAGLHNIAATLQAPSPEFSDVPTTEIGVPNFDAMSEQQKTAFLGLFDVVD